jgi:hypothetical protein
MQYDTGAFMTVIDYSVVKRNGYKLIKPLSIYDFSRIKGIGGKPIPVEYTIIPNIQIAGINFGSLYACVADFTIDAIVEPDVKAILGLNFIRGFKATTEFIDMDNIIITLQPKFKLENIRINEDSALCNPIFGSFYSSFQLLSTKEADSENKIYASKN